MWFFRTPLETLKAQSEQSAARAAKITATHSKEMRCSMRCAALCDVKRDALIKAKLDRIEYLEGVIKNRRKKCKG